MERSDLTDDQWNRLRPYLPVSNGSCGRWRDHRQVDQQDLAQGTGPMTAGLAIQATTSLPLSPWAGLGVLAAWATAALLTGGLLLRLRRA
jgi:transposase